MCQDLCWYRTDHIAWMIRFSDVDANELKRLLYSTVCIIQHQYKTEMKARGELSLNQPYLMGALEKRFTVTKNLLSQ